MMSYYRLVEMNDFKGSMNESMFIKLLNGDVKLLRYSLAKDTN